MEGSWERKGHGYIRDTCMEVTKHGGDMCMEWIMVWRGHVYGRDMCMEGTRAWRGHGNERDMDI